jgi:hypothetical protein
MLDNNQKLQVLEEILASPEFKDSKRYQDLLKYLVEETLAGNSPKEITIGIKFFERGNTFDPKEDTTVRVYINNLRKKLEHYYLTCTTPIKNKLIIPKGHYQVEFQEIEQIEEPPTAENPKSFSQNKTILIGSFIIVFIVGFLSASLFTGKPPANKTKNNPIWNEFVKPNGRPTLILLGDYFFLFERPLQDQTLGRFIRDLRINSPEDFKQLVRSDPAFAKLYVPGNFTYLRPSASWGLNYILPILQNSPNKYSLKLASQFTMDDAKTNNIVFIGSFKNLYNLQKILHLFKIDYKLSPAGFHIVGADSSRFFSPGDFKGGNYEKDYAITAKAQGPEECTMMLLMGFAETGIIEAAKFVSDPETSQKYFSGSESAYNPYFTAVIETEGINQSIMKTHIQYFSGNNSSRPSANDIKIKDSTKKNP